MIYELTRAAHIVAVIVFLSGMAIVAMFLRYSDATTLPAIIQEMLLCKTSERQGRLIDQDEGGAGMEEKKKRGYF